MTWILSSSSDPVALAVVDGLEHFDLFSRVDYRGQGAHYSRRTPGSKTFTGIGQEIVLVTECGRAVWSVVLQKTPSAVGSGGSRGRSGCADSRARFVWRNNVFRNLGAGLSSELIREATERTYVEWRERYYELPSVRLRTEVDVNRVRSTNPGCCYQKAGWERGELKRGKLFWYAPALEDQ